MANFKMDQIHDSESTVKDLNLPQFKMVNLCNQLSTSSCPIKLTLSRKPNTTKLRRLRQRKTSYIINNNNKNNYYYNISPRCYSASRAEAHILIIFLLMLFSHLSTFGQIIQGDNVAAKTRAIHHQHRYQTRHQSSSAIDYFTNNNKHQRHTDTGQLEVRPPVLLSNETTNYIDNSIVETNTHYRQQVPEQVPEQLPIVVSSSDNSYVSASPVEASTISSSTLHYNRLLHHRGSSRNKLHPQHHGHLQRAESPSRPSQRRPIMHTSNNKLLNSQTIMVERRKLIGLKQHHQDDYNNNNNNNDDDDDDDDDDDLFEPLDLGDKAFHTIGSGISTTATTTQRNKGRRYTSRRMQDHRDATPPAHAKPVPVYQRAGENHISTLDNSTEYSAKKKLGLSSRYSIKMGSIIKTRESLDSGATFINYTIVTNLKACLVECWITESCDTAIYQESPVDFNNNQPELSYSSHDQRHHSSSLNSLLSTPPPHHDSTDDIGGESEDDVNSDDDDGIESENSNLDDHSDSPHTDSTHFRPKKGKRSSEVGFFICYLFECAKPDGFKCQFSAHNNYISSLKRPSLANTVDASREYLDVEHSNSRKNADEGGGEEEEDGDDEVDVQHSNKPAELNVASQQQNNQSDNNNINISMETSDTEDGRTIWSEDAPKPDENLLRLQGGKCWPGQFKCLKEMKCISKQLICDGIYHCLDHSDEFMCDPRQADAGQVNSNIYSIIEDDPSKLDSDDTPDLKLKQTSPKTIHKLSNIITHDQRLQKVDSEEVSLNEIQVQKLRTSSATTDPSRPIVPIQLTDISSVKPHYSHIISSMNHHKFNSRTPWHDSHIASIRIGQDEFEDFGRGGLNSAIIAIIIGFGVTGVLIMIVGHKMKSIRSRLAYKSRRRSLVPDTDFLVNTIPI